MPANTCPSTVVWKRLPMVSTGNARCSHDRRPDDAQSATSGAGTRRVSLGTSISRAKVAAADGDLGERGRAARLPEGAGPVEEVLRHLGDAEPEARPSAAGRRSPWRCPR